MEAGSGFDVSLDFSGLEIDDEKVSVTFHEAKNEAGEDFDGNRADTYKAVYFVEPVSGNPSYHVCRSILVKEPAAERQSEKSTETSETGGNVLLCGKGRICCNCRVHLHRLIQCPHFL